MRAERNEPRTQETRPRLSRLRSPAIAYQGAMHESQAKTRTAAALFKVCESVIDINQYTIGQAERGGARQLVSCSDGYGGKTTLERSLEKDGKYWNTYIHWQNGACFDESSNESPQTLTIVTNKYLAGKVTRKMNNSEVLDWETNPKEMSYAKSLSSRETQNLIDYIEDIYGVLPNARDSFSPQTDSHTSVAQQPPHLEV